jgi:hypothetical protein
VETYAPKKWGPLEHELLLHFIQINGDNLKTLAIQAVKAFAKYDRMSLYLELKPYME